MSRTRSLRLVKLVANSTTSLHNMKPFFSLCPSRRNVSSSRTSNLQNALASQAPGDSKQGHSEADVRHSKLSRIRTYPSERERSKQPAAEPDMYQATLPQAIPFPTVGNMTSFVHTREPPVFGVAKDRSPAGRNRRCDVVQQEDEPIIRHDVLFLKKMPYANGKELKQRKYSQTWKEFPEKRIRPATEWGYFGDAEAK